MLNNSTKSSFEDSCICKTLTTLKKTGFGFFQINRENFDRLLEEKIRLKEAVQCRKKL